jgi:hypothetical protein
LRRKFAVVAVHAVPIATALTVALTPNVSEIGAVVEKSIQENFMRNAVLTIAAVAVLATSFVVETQALPMARKITQDETANVTQVRDGCGFRRHWSPRFRRCVWDGRGNY